MDYSKGFEDAVDDELAGCIPDEAQTIKDIIEWKLTEVGEMTVEWWRGYQAALRTEFSYK